MPGGPECYRRVLLEVAVDPAAAAEPVHIGLKKSGALKSGHAWLGDRRGTDERFDVELVV
jgi:hypothetical protein